MVIGIVGGLVLGKTIGIFGSTYLLARFTRAELDENITWSDLLGLAMLAGVGFTVSLLIGELAFGTGSVADEHVKIAVLIGSVTSAVLASVILLRRNAPTAGFSRGDPRRRPGRYPRRLPAGSAVLTARPRTAPPAGSGATRR